MIINFKSFLNEYYEGGPPSKDAIKIKDRMLTDIILWEDEEEDDEVIPILKDVLENKDIDPFGEEDWKDDEIEYSYIKWKSEKKGDLYDFLKQLKNSYINACLKNIKKNNISQIKFYKDEIMSELIYRDYNNKFSYGTEKRNNLKMIYDDFDDLDQYCPDYDDGEKSYYEEMWDLNINLDK